MISLKKRIIQLQWALSGLHRGESHNNKPPYTTPDCLNVRSEDQIQKRNRGGSRPGIQKAFYEQLGSGNPLRMIDGVDVVKNDGRTFWSDYFQNLSLGNVWSTASWLSSAPSIWQNGGTVSDYNEEVGAVRSAIDGLDTTNDYVIDMFIAPYRIAYHGEYKVFFRMDDSSPDVTQDGVEAKLVMDDGTGAYSGTLTVYSSGSPTSYNFSSSSTSGMKTGIYRIIVSGNNVKAYWCGESLIDQDISAPAGSRVGFGMKCTQSGGACMCYGFRIQYFETDYRTETREILCASSNGSFYRDTWNGIMELLSTNTTLASKHFLQATRRYQKLYIADYDNPATSQSDGNISGVYLTSPSVSDFTDLGIDVDSFLCVLSNSSGPTDGNYGIDSLLSGSVALSSAPGDGNCSFSIERAPKVYDPSADTLTLMTPTAGEIPVGAYGVCLYRDRLVWIKDHIWYMSRQEDPLDYDYGEDPDDPQKAIAGQNSNAGIIGQKIIVAIPFGDDYIIWGCERELWRLRGDPQYGGQNDNVSRNAGIIGRRAWTVLPDGSLVFMSHNGLCRLHSAASSNVEILSEDRLPQEMKNIDTTRFDVSLAYNSRFNGIDIYITPKSDQNRKHWFFDLKNYAFWPEQYQDDHQPTCVYEYRGRSNQDACVLLGGKDGYIRKHDSMFVNDDGYEINSYIYLGPIRVWNDYYDGRINEINATLAENSGDLTWQICSGNSHESAILNSGDSTGTWTAGMNYTNRPNVVAGSAVLKLSNANANEHWALEKIILVLEQRGKSRLL